MQALGAEPVVLPLLEIEPLDADAPALVAARHCILDLDLYHAVIFISANAARLGADLIDEYWPQLPVGVYWLAIGASTAKTLCEQGIEAIHSPRGYDSEALLEAAPLQQLTGLRVLLVCGEGGRDKLATELEARGARVDRAELYRRAAPKTDRTTFKSAVYAKPLSAILITSGEGLNNLIRLAADADTASGLAGLQQCRLVVPSPRIAAQAHDAGFKRILLASGPDDQSMIGALLNQPDSEQD